MQYFKFNTFTQSVRYAAKANVQGMTAEKGMG